MLSYLKYKKLKTKYPHTWNYISVSGPEAVLQIYLTVVVKLAYFCNSESV